MNRFSPLILASRSPRRAELLRAAGILFEIKPADVDETIRPGENAEAYVCRVADAKARAIAGADPSRLVVGADTVVVVDDTILGKPTGSDDAVRMLRMLSGRAHLVLTGLCLAGPELSFTTRIEATTVEFAPLTDSELEWYVATGEPMDKAGAYAIQGRGSRFVSRIEGSYSNVVGLPVQLLYQLCTRAGILIS
jgi:septum formation protein